MHRDLVIVTIAMMTWGIGEGAFVYFQPIYLQQLGAEPLLIGSILGAMGIMMTIAHIPAGYLADRIGRRTMLRASWTMGLSAGILMASANSLPVFVTGMLLYGFTAFVMSPLSSYITAARGNLSVTRALTLVLAIYNIGAVIGPLIGGFIGEIYGIRSIYSFSAIIFALSSVLVFNIGKQPLEQRTGESLNGLLRNTPYKVFLIIIFVVMFATYLPQPLSPNFLNNERGVDLGLIGTIGSVGNLGNVIILLILGSWNPLFGIIVGQVLVGLFALILWQGNSIFWYGIGYFLLGGYRAVRSLSIAHISSLVEPAKMGLSYGIAETISGFGIILAPPLAGFFYGKSPESIYQVSIVVISLSILISLILTPRKKRSTHELGV